MSFNIQPADKLAGKKVTNSDGEDLGHLDKLMIDAETGFVAYAVLSFGGIMGFGDKHFAVPFQALAYDTEADCYLLEVDKERLEDAPKFEEGEWPEADDRFLDDVYVFYDVEPHWRTWRLKYASPGEAGGPNRPSHPAAVRSS